MPPCHLVVVRPCQVCLLSLLHTILRASPCNRLLIVFSVLQLTLPWTIKVLTPLQLVLVSLAVVAAVTVMVVVVVVAVDIHPFVSAVLMVHIGHLYHHLDTVVIQGG